MQLQVSQTAPAPALTFTDEQIKLIKTTIMPPGSTDDETKLFMAYVNRTGLDPLSRQIYPMRNADRISMGATIDGFRLIAERSRRYRGQLPAMWCGPDGVWRDVWLSTEPPAAAKVGVLRADFDQPLYAIAHFREYARTGKDGKPTYQWRNMPALMLAKCAEALALRKAFPNDLSGLYIAEEMSSVPNVELPADVVADMPKLEQTDETITPDQAKRLASIMTAAGFDGTPQQKILAREFLAFVVGIPRLDEVRSLTRSQADRLLAALATSAAVDDQLALWSASKAQPVPDVVEAEYNEVVDAEKFKRAQFALMNELNLNGPESRNSRLGLLSALLGRRVGSANDIGANEWAMANKRLAEFVTTWNLHATGLEASADVIDDFVTTYATDPSLQQNTVVAALSVWLQQAAKRSA